MSELERLRAQVAAVKALTEDESRHVVRWIDDTHLVDVADLRDALAAADGTSVEPTLAIITRGTSDPVRWPEDDAPPPIGAVD